MKPTAVSVAVIHSPGIAHFVARPRNIESAIIVGNAEGWCVVHAPSSEERFLPWEYFPRLEYVILASSKAIILGRINFSDFASSSFSSMLMT